MIKVAQNGPPTYQFHFRFPFQTGDFQYLGLAPHSIDLSNYSLNPGISFEYTGSEVLRKLYYYLNRPEEKDIIAKQFSEPWCRRADMLEYTQTDKARKVILWMYESATCQEYFSQLDWPLLSELIADSLGRYEDIALRLTREPDALAALKAKLLLHRDTCALFDTARFTRNLEAAYTTMWERHRRGAVPESFAVGDAP